jgi:hypothetical protein
MRVLLTEGSSLTSRETITCLGPAGHHLEVLDPNPICLARFSRWIRHVHSCPHAGREPLRYIERLAEVVRRNEIDVVLPTHEQAWLLANAGELLPDYVHVALAEAEAFAHVQSKLAFAELLEELGLPQPTWRRVRAAGDLDGLAFPYWLKSAFSTAGQGVREIIDERSRAESLAALLGDAPLIAQAPAAGRYGQVQGLFDHGRMVAVHTSVQQGRGIGGSAAARLSVDHPEPREHIAVIGEALGWHGGLTLDYFHEEGEPSYIECNPRTVEPGNASSSGVNIPDLQLRLTLGEALPSPARVGRPGVRTHGTIALLLGSAADGASRRMLLTGLRDAITHRGLYAQSAEQLTPVVRDPPSFLAAAFVTGRTLMSARNAARLAEQAVSGYSIGPTAVAAVARAAGRPPVA